MTENEIIVLVNKYRKYITTERLRLLHNELGELFTMKDVAEMIAAVKKEGEVVQ